MQLNGQCNAHLIEANAHLKEVHLLRNSQQNMRTIIRLLLCYNIAKIQIIVEL